MVFKEKNFFYLILNCFFFFKRNTCFDCHLYKGRIINIVVRDSNTNGQIADGSIDAEILAFKAKDKVLHQDWVSLLKPCWFLFIIFYYFRFRSI